MIRLAYGRMLRDGLDGVHGLRRARLDELAARFPAVQGEVHRRRGEGEYGFYRLVDQAGPVREITTFAEGVGQAYDHVLVLGIGGSALGAKALLTALRRPAWNEWDDEGREFFPRLTVLDNVDPTTVSAALARIDPRRVLVNVISKSGGTAETMAQYLIVRAWLEDALGSAAHRHLVFTTDPGRGALREIAARDGIASLSVPPEVGGRFSVLSPVGLLPAALYAALHWAADTDLGARIHVLMPYTDRLRDFAEWYRQLWAESLGKRVSRAGKELFSGPTPLAAVGATDQHSQVQLFMEGPFDKVITFAVVDDLGDDLRIPPPPTDVPGVGPLPPDLAYLSGHSLAALLRAEYEATATALARMGRMSCTLRLPRLDAETFGEAIMFFQLATGYAGVFYGVDPFDQPGVELGKKLTYAALGRPGYEGHAQPSGTVDQDEV